jgi:tetratricopeptide (TPR) repeat protein
MIPAVILALVQAAALVRADGAPPEAPDTRALGSVECRQGEALLRRRQFDEAILHFRKALELNPQMADAQSRWGDALVLLGKPQDAIEHYGAAIAVRPDDDEAHANLGEALMRLDRTEEAIASLRKAVAINPLADKAHYNLANLLMRGNMVDEAVEHYRAALKVKPEFAAAHCNLGNALAALGRPGEAVVEFQAALDINPRHDPARNNLAWILATTAQDDLRDGDRAVRLAEGLCADSYRMNPAYLMTLAAAYAETGRFEDALQAARESRLLAKGDADLTAQMSDAIATIEARHPVRSP